MTDHHQTAARTLAKCAAYDPWFPQPNRATVDAWAEQISEYELDESFVLEGVRMAYRDNGAGFRPLPRDIVQAARVIRRERAERESTDERQKREDRHDAELAHRNRLGSMITAVAKSKSISDV